VRDVFVAEIVLQGSGIDALIGQLEAAGMTQHLRVNLKWHLRRGTEKAARFKNRKISAVIAPDLK
jgi:hypothetical protein